MDSTKTISKEIDDDDKECPPGMIPRDGKCVPADDTNGEGIHRDPKRKREQDNAGDTTQKGTPTLDDASTVTEPPENKECPPGTTLGEDGECQAECESLRAAGFVLEWSIIPYYVITPYVQPFRVRDGLNRKRETPDDDSPAQAPPATLGSGLPGSALAQRSRAARLCGHHGHPGADPSRGELDREYLVRRGEAYARRRHDSRTHRATSARVGRPTASLLRHHAFRPRDIEGRGPASRAGAWPSLAKGHSRRGGFA